MKTVIIDVGTGLTKMGFAGNSFPTHIIPTVVSDHAPKDTDVSNFLDVDIGVPNSTRYPNLLSTEIMSTGIIEDWGKYEKFLLQSYSEKLRVEPSEHYSLFTEPPANPPENREKLAEIMFETFGVPGLYIGVQAVMALFASRISKRAERNLTGVVVDSGAGVTHVIPIIDGYVVGTCMKTMPLAGRDITNYIREKLVARNEPVPPTLRKRMADKIKKELSYSCRDIVSEFAKYDSQPEEMFRTASLVERGKTYTASAGYERFMAPELFFSPEMYGSSFTQTLPELVDECVRMCPITSRLSLYRNIILSGGSTMFKDFGKRLQRDMQRIVKDVHNNQVAEVKVISHAKQSYAVWFGASILAQMPQFENNIHTKQKYDEVGPRIARYNAVFFE